MARLICPLLVLLGGFMAGEATGQRERTPLLTRSEPQDWRLRTAISLGSRVDVPAEAFVHCPHDPGGTTPVEMARDLLLRGDDGVARVAVEEATVYFPVADRSAAYEVDRESLTAEILYNGRPIPLRQTLYVHDAAGEPIHSGGGYGIWSFGPANRFVPTVTMQFEFEARAWNITLDEAAAREIGWPQGDWPADAASSLKPMLFVDRGFEDDYDRRAIEQILREWTGGNPRSQPPLVLAKWIAGQVSNSFQPIGTLTTQDSIAGNSVQAARSLGAMQALNATPLDRAAENMVGTPLDMTLLLTALYREAGLPARVVIGYVAGDEGGGRDPVRRSDEPELGVYAWVEFALYDETAASLADSLTWIPVDILAMRAGNVGRRPLEQNWDGFGRSEYFNQIIPLAYHLHPHRLPAVSYGVGDANTRLRRVARGIPVRSAAPSLWGWNVVPATPAAMHQTIVFSATTPSRTAEDFEREQRGGGR